MLQPMMPPPTITMRALPGMSMPAAFSNEPIVGSARCCGKASSAAPSPARRVAHRRTHRGESSTMRGTATPPARATPGMASMRKAASQTGQPQGAPLRILQSTGKRRQHGRAAGACAASPSWRRPRGEARRAFGACRRVDALHHAARSGATRCSTKRGSRSSSGTPTPSSRRSASTSATTPKRWRSGRPPAPTWRASACAVPRGMCRSIVQATAPREFVQHARNPERSVPIGGKHTVFAPVVRVAVHPQPRRGPPLRDDRGLPQLREARVYGAVAAPLGRHDLRAGRPAGQQAALRHGVQPHEVQRQAVHGLGHARRARRRTRSRWRRSLFGDGYIDAATGKPRTVVISLINANSPMTFDATMLGALKVYARANQACIVTPFILAGAMSPVTVAGTAAQTLAEALSGMAFTQLVGPGAPVRARQLRVVDLDAVGRADLRHARAGAGALRDGRARAAARCAVPLGRRALRLEDPRRAGGLRVAPTRCCRPASPASISSCTRRAGSRAASRWATRNS